MVNFDDVITVADEFVPSMNNESTFSSDMCEEQF